MKPSEPGTEPTLLQAASDSKSMTLRDEASPPERRSVPDGYELGVLLGRGGMGEVMLATDSEIGRQVAIKRIRGDLGTMAEARFLREAQIQARLDHPAIVPVHQIGRDPDGRPFFTMKRVTGTTLESTIQNASPQQLLRTFVDVCLAIDFAHSRGIVHRDLKPANIMLGDFGEVYVLDWGLARVLDEAEDTQTAFAKVPTDSGQTEVGSLLGTPGYMSPEQVRGESVGAATDVYALGSILFELLTHEALHPRGAAAISATLQRPTVAPSERKRDVPPELCIATQDALADVPGERPTARVLADRVQKYLDGDRDLERRRVLAAAQLAAAREALDADDRGLAMQTAGRALALDPESHDAAQILTSLTLEPPVKNPPELAAHLAAEDLIVSRRQWRQVALAWIAFYVPLPLMLVAGVRDPLQLVAFYTPVTVSFLLACYWTKYGRPRHVVSMICAIASMVALSRLLGPFILVPTILGVMANGFLSYPTHIRRPSVPIALLVGGFLLIVGLEEIGVLARTWTLVGNALVSQSAFINFEGTIGSVILIGANALVILVCALFARSIAASRWEANRKLEIQAWHLRKLVPA
ncbi:MAG: serine/threonine protein kinase [Deltaproteobacteria bacterium]|nr:serine/threonine protein kinase [Deltaproteobacteria bacterium]